MEQLCRTWYGIKENIKSLNAFLDNLQAEAYEVHRYLYENDKEITAEAIKNKMLGKSETSYTLIEIFKEHIERQKAWQVRKFLLLLVNAIKPPCSIPRHFQNASSV